MLISFKNTASMSILLYSENVKYLSFLNYNYKRKINYDKNYIILLAVLRNIISSLPKLMIVSNNPKKINENFSVNTNFFLYSCEFLMLF